MKTKNNVQKAILKSTVTGIVFVLISIALSAQDFGEYLLENSRFNPIAFAMVNSSSYTNSSSNDVDAFTTYLVEEIEEPMALEDWMLNEELFNNNLEAEEEPLELENWMIDETIFDVNSIYFEDETERELELEDWMINEELFNSNAKEEEEPLELEEWMTSDKIWIN